MYRILQAGKYYPPDMGGIEKVTCDLSEGLNSTGCHCDVLVSNSKRRSITETYRDVVVHRERSYGELLSTPISLAYIRKLMSIAESYDIVQVHLPNPLASFALALKKPRVAIVVLWHADAVSHPRLYRVIAPLDRAVLDRAAAIIATSSTYAKTSEPLKDYQDKLHIVALGIPERATPIDMDAYRSARDRFSGKKLVFSLGRLVGYKGFHVLVQAARYLPEEFAIVIGGDGPLKSDIGRLISTLNLEHRIFLVGHLSGGEVTAFFEACRLFCLPSVT